jgi:hypothetical protein
MPATLNDVAHAAGVSNVPAAVPNVTMFYIFYICIQGITITGLKG